MIDSRASLALGGGLNWPDEGQIAVINPPTDATLAALPGDRVCVIEGFKPAFDLWKQRGFQTRVHAEAAYSTVVVCLPRAKAEARAIIAQAMMLSTGPVIIDGQKTDGVDSIFKEMRQRIEVSKPISKAHGKLFWCAKPDAQVFEDWRAGPVLTAGGFWTGPGVFSADGIDPASALLVEALPDKMGRKIGDLGAGWGFLSAHVLTRADVDTVHLVEADYLSLECARRNVGDPRAIIHWDDATKWSAPDKLDSVVMNPPFHVSRAADPGLGQAFVQAAASVLSPQGHLWMVANRHLPYEQTLQKAFTNVFEIGGDARFKLFHATRPRQNAGR